MLDPKILSDEEIRLCYNEWSKRYRKNNPEKAREAIKILAKKNTKRSSRS